MNTEILDVPFDIQYGDLEDEDYAALSHYYACPYDERDPSEIAYIRDKYDWIGDSVIAADRLAMEEAIQNCNEDHLWAIWKHARYNLDNIQNSFDIILSSGLDVAQVKVG